MLSVADVEEKGGEQEQESKKQQSQICSFTQPPLGTEYGYNGLPYTIMVERKEAAHKGRMLVARGWPERGSRLEREMEGDDDQTTQSKPRKRNTRRVLSQS